MKQEKTDRKPAFPINSIILDRWSQRAMTGEHLSDAELMPLFEAARWAPSASNHQPWRFIYAKRDTPSWKSFFNLLADGNKRWCANAAVLIVIISKKTYDNGTFSGTHSFSAGSAFENLALEGSSRGLVVHGMAGFDYGKSRNDLGVPEDYDVDAMAAIGKLAKKETLPEDLQAREAPSGRKPFNEMVMEGKFRS